MYQKKDLLMLNLSKYFSTWENISKIITIINSESKISLRVVDWFVTNYSKKHNIHTVSTENIPINIYIDYRSQLKSFSKHQFDPFRRWERISFVYKDKNDKESVMETTVGQLNFFRWAIKTNLIKYINDNYENIEKDMLFSQRENQQKRKDCQNIKVSLVKSIDGKIKQITRKRRSELSKSAMKSMNKVSLEQTLSFD